MASTLNIGIDISQRHHDLVGLTDQGEVVLAHERFPYTRAGVQALAARVAATMQAGAFDHLRIGGEATGLLWLHLFWELQESDVLAPFEPDLVLVNAHPVQRFKAVLEEQEKTDAKDALTLAEWLRTRRVLPHRCHLEADRLALQRQTRYRFHLVQTLAREKIHARQVLLALKMNTYRPQQPFSDPFATSGLAVLTQYVTLDELITRDLDDLAAELQHTSRGALADPHATAQQFQDLAAQAFQLPPPLDHTITELLVHSRNVIAALEQRLAALDRQIQARAETLPGYPHLRSVPGIGPVYAAGLLAETQDIRRFLLDRQGQPRTRHQVQAAFAKFAGLWWPRAESGSFQAQNRRLAKTGNRYLRYYLVEAANSVRHHLPDYRAFYQLKYAHSVRYHHRRALTLTARKLARLVVALLLDDRDFQPRGGDPPA